MQLRPLPAEVDDLLLKSNASPRLRANLALVHDVACQLTDQLKVAWPDLAVDWRAVHMGAAIHDIGKTVYPEELTEPGREHEIAGYELLISIGWAENLSRFSVTHGRCLGADDPLEDLLVAVADKVWKGKREDALEQALVTRVAVAARQEPWQVWLTLDDILTGLGEAAPERLNWQARHKV